MRMSSQSGSRMRILSAWRTCVLLLLLWPLLACEAASNLIRNRIVGGKTTSIEKYPYVMLLEPAYCGSSAIADRWALTAAHCTADFNIEDLRVRAGTSILSHGGIVVRVSHIVEHPNFDYDLRENDLSLLYLETSLATLTGFEVKPVLLPYAGDDKILVPGTKMRVVGWGLTEEEGRPSLILQEAELPFVSWDSCREVYPAITEDVLCTGLDEGGVDACRGDSGGPLVYGRVLVGVVSYALGCARPKTPGVYTRVSRYLPWLLNATDMSAEDAAAAVVAAAAPSPDAAPAPASSGITEAATAATD